MQAVILAAGRGVRMGRLTDDMPKPLLPIAGKSLLERKLEILPETVHEVVIVIGYKGELIKAQYGEKYNGKHVRYVEQEMLDGSAGALWRAEPLLGEDFVVLMGDDLYSKNDVMRMTELHGWGMGVLSQQKILQGGRIVLNEKDEAVGIEPQSLFKDGGGFANTGLYHLDKRIFSYPLVALESNPKEYGLPQTILAASRASGIPLQTQQGTFWKQVTTEDDIGKLEATPAL